MTTISKFVAGLKKSLRAAEDHRKFAITGAHWDTNADPSEVDWEELDKAIDEFCAEFKAKQMGA